MSTSRMMTQDAKTSELLNEELGTLRQRVARLEQTVVECKRVEKELRESAQMYTQILDAIPDMVLCKRQKSRIVYANKAFRDFYGMTMEQMRDIIDAPFNDPDYTQQYIIDDAYVFNTGQTLDIPAEPVTRYDGEVRLFHTVKTAIFDAEGNVVKTVGFSRDITDRKQAEVTLKNAKEKLEIRVEKRTVELKNALEQLQSEMSDRHRTESALQESYNLLHAVIEGTTDAIFVKDLQGRYITINSAGAHPMGKSVEDFIGKDDTEIFPPEVARQLMENDRKIIMSGTTQTLEEVVTVGDRTLTFLSTKGVYRDPSGNIIGLVGISRDITERKLSEEKLRHQTSELQAIFQAFPDLFFRLDFDGTILDYKAGSTSPLYVPPDFFLGKRMQNVLPPQVGQQANDAILEAIEAKSLGTLGSTTVQVEYSLPIENEERSFEARLLPFLEKQIIVIVRDITKRKQTEKALQQSEARLREQATQLEKALQELQRTQAQLVQTEKMSSLGQLVAGVAHEINNPVSFIYGNLNPASNYIQDLLHLLDLYQQHYPNPVPQILAEIEAIDLDFIVEDLPKVLGSIKMGAERIRDIVRSLRIFSRLDEAEIKQVDIHSGIDSTLRLLQKQLKQTAGHPGIQVIKEYGNLPNVECYAGQLNQVFMNILTNAIDALDEYNIRRSPSEIKQHPSTIRIRTYVVDSDRVAILIADNGPGMTEDVCSRLFDPFFTTKPVGQGTGLGLAISHSIIVEKHRGQIQCISAPGQGAEFLISIPLRQQAMRNA